MHQPEKSIQGAITATKTEQRDPYLYVGIFYS
jgi:hypothetical protein